MDIRSDAPRYELYNLDQDPGETHDLSAENPDILSRLQQIMAEAHTSNPDFPVLKEEASGPDR